MEEISKELARAVMEFVTDSHMKMMQKRIDTKDLRIAFPKYLERYFIEGMYHLHGRAFGVASELNEIYGIPVHPTWENALTLYFVSYPQAVFADIPVFKLSFATESKDYGLGKAVITHIAKTYGYKQ